MAMTLTNQPSGPSKNHQIFNELNRLIHEYLEITGLGKTLSTFTDECKEKSLPCSTLIQSDSHDSKAAFTQTDAKALLDSFDNGDLASFIKKWKLFLSYIQITSEDMKKLEVYLRVYFAIWPKAQELPDKEQARSMSLLKMYFEEHSSELSADPTILPLFALPFVQDPKTHPVFNELFEKLWSDRLRTQLEATLSKYFELLQENIAYHSKLASIVLKSQSNSYGSQIENRRVSETLVNYHQDRFFQLMTTYRKVRKLLRGMRESYGKLLKVSNELIQGLESAVSGKEASEGPTIEKCFQIFPELFCPDINGAEGPDKEYFKKISNALIFNEILDSDVSLFFIGISDLGPESLNYAKIKETLVSPNVKQTDKLCLLQALRWLLTKTSVKCREFTMEAFISADILELRSPAPPGMNKENDYRTKLFSTLLTPTPTYFKECFARLLNAFASIRNGRTYLSGNSFCLDALVNSLFTFKGENESYICQMVIATLQKMSLRKKMRLGMIEKNVIQWLAVFLKNELEKHRVSKSRGNNEENEIEDEDEDEDDEIIIMNPYLLEYGWALLMNLSLHEEARPASSSIATDILTSVIHMLQAKPAPDVAPYVVSTLYSLLRNPEVFAIAKKMKLQDTLSEIVGNSKSEMAHHLKKLIEVLSLKGYDRITTTGEVDYDDDDNADPDEFEPELELTEAWVSTLESSAPTGDDLLIRQYLLHREIVIPSTPNPKAQGVKIYSRPTTPSKAHAIGVDDQAKFSTYGIRKIGFKEERASSKSPDSSISKNSESARESDNSQHDSFGGAKKKTRPDSKVKPFESSGKRDWGSEKEQNDTHTASGIKLNKRNSSQTKRGTSKEKGIRDNNSRITNNK